MNTYLITIKGNDTFVYECTISAKDDMDVIHKVANLMINLKDMTIEQFVDIHVTKV